MKNAFEDRARWLRLLLIYAELNEKGRDALLAAAEVAASQERFLDLESNRSIDSA